MLAVNPLCCVTLRCPALRLSRLNPSVLGSVVTLVRVAYSARPQQRLTLPLNGAFLALLDIVEVFLRLGVPFRMTRERTRQASLPTLRVGSGGRGSPGSARVLNRRLRRAVDVAVGIALAAPSRVFVVDAHDEHRALHRRRDQVDEPGAPAFPAQASKQACREQETAGCLDAHHGNAETSHVLKVVGHPNLWHVLDGSQDSSHDAEQISPEDKVIGEGDEEDARQDDHDEAMENAEETDQDGRLPSRSISAEFLWRNIGLSITEEDEEKNEAIQSVS